MPTYEYACTACGHRLEAVQKFTDDALTVCPECQGALRKVFGAVGIAFKGSGFYKTDSRAGSGKSGADTKESKVSDTPSSSTSSDASSSSSDKSSSSDTAKAGSGKDSSSKESKPAAAAAS